MMVLNLCLDIETPPKSSLGSLNFDEDIKKPLKQRLGLT